MADEDKRRLIAISIKKLENNLWNIKIDGGESYNVEADFDSIKKVLRRIKAKDGCEHGKCRSSKIGTYKSMLGNIDNNDLHKINVWKSKVPHNPQDFIKLMMESKEMKTITLTKNYIVEGVIVPKGTLIEFKEKEITVDDLNSLKNRIDSFVISKGKAPSDLMKEYKNMIKILGDSVVWSDDKEEWVLNESLKEKLDFLPEEIWNKAQEITDEHERFEFIKAELNKLGTNYSDDEIEDFINKYKTELNESLTEKEVEGLGDMLDMLEETMESEDYVAKDKIDEILDIASSDEKLLGAWEAMLTADDKTFNKKENAFWTRFDEICKPFKK